MSKIPIVQPFNAITSWEDYEYQGHVALYYALKNILNLLQSCKSISGYELQIEGEEDFSIRKDTIYISLHQVKAGAVKLELNDKFSFIMGILQNEAKSGYFHISNGKKFHSRCNIILNQIPDEGRIFIVKNEIQQSVETVISKVKRTDFISQYKLLPEG